MNTEYLTVTGNRETDEEVIRRAADVIRSGGLVAIPTETVYGLAGSAYLEGSAQKIFAAKGRPADNPLIVHIAEPGDADSVAYTNPLYFALAKKFMPGPLTVILKKRDCIPSTVTAGMETVAIRCPSNPVAHRLIEVSGHPIAAPSANRSGSPSPTSAAHVRADLDGLLDMIVDGGECEIGLESTVIRLDGEDACTVLRPGAVTPDMLAAVCRKVMISPAVMEPQLAGDAPPESPGMKYRHYSPKAEIVLIDAPEETFLRYVRENAAGHYGVMIPNEDAGYFNGGTMLLTGPRNDAKEASRRLFSLLRRADEAGLDRVYVRLPLPEGETLALYNRIVRSAGCRILKLGGSGYPYEK